MLWEYLNLSSKPLQDLHITDFTHPRGKKLSSCVYIYVITVCLPNSWSGNNKFPSRRTCLLLLAFRIILYLFKIIHALTKNRILIK